MSVLGRCGCCVAVDCKAHIGNPPSSTFDDLTFIEDPDAVTPYYYEDMKASTIAVTTTTFSPPYASGAESISLILNKPLDEPDGSDTFYLFIPGSAQGSGSAYISWATSGGMTYITINLSACTSTTYFTPGSMAFVEIGNALQGPEFSGIYRVRKHLDILACIGWSLFVTYQITDTSPYKCSVGVLIRLVKVPA